MNQEDIIRMAREAGMEQDGNNFFSPMSEEMDVHISDLERFADLVVAEHADKLYEAGWNSALEMAAFRLQNDFKRSFGEDTLASIAVYIKEMKK